MNVLKLWIITVKDSNYWDYLDLRVYFTHQYIWLLHVTYLCLVDLKLTIGQQNIVIEYLSIFFNGDPCQNIWILMPKKTWRSFWFKRFFIITGDIIKLIVKYTILKKKPGHVDICEYKFLFASVILYIKKGVIAWIESNGFRFR